MKQFFTFFDNPTDFSFTNVAILIGFVVIILGVAWILAPSDEPKLKPVKK